MTEKKGEANRARVVGNAEAARLGGGYMSKGSTELTRCQMIS